MKMSIYHILNRKHRFFIVSTAVVSGVCLNALFNGLVQVLDLPIFLDSVCTVLVAALFGLWPGVATGFLTNLLMEALTGFPGTQFPFAAVNILTALLTVLLVRKSFFDSLPGILISVMVLALANALAGAFIVTLVFGGITGENVDQIVRAITVTGRSIFSAAFLARILINVVDKGISVLAVYPFYRKASIRAGRNDSSRT